MTDERIEKQKVQEITGNHRQAGRRTKGTI